jgi:hypothetical protein
VRVANDWDRDLALKTLPSGQGTVGITKRVMIRCKAFLDKWNSNNGSLFTKTWKNVITSPTAAREQSGFVLRHHALENP